MLLSFCCFWNSTKLQKGSFMIDPWSVPLPLPLQSSDSWMFVKENPYKKIVERKRTRRNHYQIVLLAIFDWRHLKWFTEFVGNKVKGRISKRLFQENKAHQIFGKTNNSIFLNLFSYHTSKQIYIILSLILALRLVLSRVQYSLVTKTNK